MVLLQLIAAAGEALTRTFPATNFVIITPTCLVSILTVLIASLYFFSLCKRTKDPAACRRLGLIGKSNLTDEQDKKYFGTSQPHGEIKWRVKSLWIYPVKSCKGVELDQGIVVGNGMDYDRQFSLARYVRKPKAGADEHEWRFLTQRQLPAMANITTEIWIPEPTTPSYSPNHPHVQSGGVLVVRYPSINTRSSNFKKTWSILTRSTEVVHHVLFNPTSRQIKTHGYCLEPMTIWKDSPRSLKMASTNDDASWLHGLQRYLKAECAIQGISIDLDVPLALFRVSEEGPRQLFRNAPRKEDLGFQPSVGFQDAYPLHIMNLASVRNVGQRLEPSAPPLSARNFRPNIIITGGEAHAEDLWKRINIGNEEYHTACRTVRCLLPNVNPSTGERHKAEPNKTLKAFRCIDAGDPKNACLGMQMVPAVEERRVIKVGDEVRVLETGEHTYIKQ